MGFLWPSIKVIGVVLKALDAFQHDVADSVRPGADWGPENEAETLKVSPLSICLLSECLTKLLFAEYVG
jgi:hypothetical protein